MDKVDNPTITPEISNPNMPILTDDLKTRYQNHGHTVRVLVLAVIISVIFGGAGGTAGSYYFLRSPFGQKLLNNYPSADLNQKLVVNEDSATIDLVKKASPAVVSIVISKDLNKIPGYSTDPNNQDPFFNFFINPGGQPQSQQPNSTPNVQEIGAGSGFLISADGLILTNKHVVSDDAASYTVLTSDGKKYDAKVLAKDPVNDLALVKIDIQNAPFLQLADSGQLQVGEHVVAIGNSLGQYQNTVTSGIVSGIGRKVVAGDYSGSSEQLSGVIQTDAAINPGNSGGPLLDIAAQVVGINTAIDQQGQLVGFAIPSNVAAKAVVSYKKNGKITSAFLGVRYTIITSDIAQQENLPRDYGALIVRGQTMADLAVLPGSPADKAGIMENDIILEVNGTKVDENNTLSDLLSKHNPGDSVSLKVYHKGAESVLSVTLAESK